MTKFMTAAQAIKATQAAREQAIEQAAAQLIEEAFKHIEAAAALGNSSVRYQMPETAQPTSANVSSVAWYLKEQGYQVINHSGLQGPTILEIRWEKV